MNKVYPVLLLLLVIKTAHAQLPASLDLTFDGDGLTALSKPLSALPQVKSEHLLQPDGKIVICANSALPSFFDTEIMVARFNPNGTVDSTFGTNGIFNYAITTGYNLAVGLALQPDGKIVTSGICNDGSTFVNQTFILRLHANGTLDTAFGTGGFSRWEFSPDDERVTDMKRMDDGSFIIGGIISSTVASDSAYIIKVMPDGKLDSSFADNGLFRYQHNGEQTHLYAVETTPDKSVIGAGSNYTPGGAYQNVFIIKLDSTGTIFTGFANGGVLQKDLFSDYDEVHSLKRLPNGDLLAAGYAYDDINTFNDGSFVMKIDASGNPVNSFGINSVSYFSTPGTPNRTYDMDVQPNGKIVLAGEWFNNTTFNDDLMVLRLLANGMPDTSFNNSTAYVTTDFLSEYDEASSVLIQPDGKIVVYGTAVLDQNTQEVSPVLARYRGGEAGVTLAVELLSFSGKQTEKNISLSWVTAHEINHDHFIVEKSSDGIHFKAAAKINAAGNSSGVNQYSYTDRDLKAPKNYYRLKITDRDAKFRYSKVLSFSTGKEGDVLVYPTVTGSGLTIQTNRQEKFYLFTSGGQLVGTLSPGTNDVSRLPSGVYYLKASDKVIKITRQ